MPPSKKTESATNLRRSSRSTRGSIKPVVDLTYVEISDEDDNVAEKDNSTEEEVQIVESEESEEDYEYEVDDEDEAKEDDVVEEEEEDEDYEEQHRKLNRRSSSAVKSKGSAKKQTKSAKGSKKSTSTALPDQDIINICYELNEKEMRDINNAFDLNCSTDGEELMNSENLKTSLRALGFEPRTDEIQRLFQKFSKRNKVNRDGFHKIMAFKLGSTPGKGDNIVDDEISRVFNLLDIDKTGLLTVENLKSIAQELNEEITDEELHEMIAEADLDGDFKINKQEFYNIMKKTSLY